METKINSEKLKAGTYVVFQAEDGISRVGTLVSNWDQDFLVINSKGTYYRLPRTAVTGVTLWQRLYFRRSPDMQAVPRRS